MKILYLTPPHIDYLSDQIYTGLSKILGWESVVDFPYKTYYHDPSSKVPFLLQNPGRRYEHDEVVTLLEHNKFDFVVLSAIPRGALEALETLSQRVPPFPILLLMSNIRTSNSITGLELFAKVGSRKTSITLMDHHADWY